MSRTSPTPWEAHEEIIAGIRDWVIRSASGDVVAQGLTKDDAQRIVLLMNAWGRGEIEAGSVGERG